MPAHVNPTEPAEVVEPPPGPVRDVPVDWEALEDAFENNAPEVHSYLQIATGEVIRVVDGVADPQMHARIAADPGYVAHFKEVVEELLTRYEVAGVHLDRIRTPGPGFCHSPELDRLFAQEHGTDTTKWAAFSRDRIDEVVKAVREQVAPGKR